MEARLLPNVSKFWWVDFEKSSFVYHCFFVAMFVVWLKHAPSRELRLTAGKTVFSHLRHFIRIVLSVLGLQCRAIRHFPSCVHVTLLWGRDLFWGNRCTPYKKCYSYNWARSLLSTSQNRKHLKKFRKVDCVLANHNKVQDTRANLKTTN